MLINEILFFRTIPPSLSLLAILRLLAVLRYSAWSVAWMFGVWRAYKGVLVGNHTECGLGITLPQEPPCHSPRVSDSYRYVYINLSKKALKTRALSSTGLLDGAYGRTNFTK